MRELAEVEGGYTAEQEDARHWGADSEDQLFAPPGPDDNGGASGEQALLKQLQRAGESMQFCFAKLFRKFDGSFAMGNDLRYEGADQSSTLYVHRQG